MSLGWVSRQKTARFPVACTVRLLDGSTSEFLRGVSLPSLLSKISAHLPLIIISSFRNCENMIIVASVDEAEYRQSRLCRLLGNPIAFTVVSLLAEGKEMNTSEIAKAAGRSVSRVSNILGALRLAEVVRYQTEGTRAQYRLKHPREIRRILAALSGFVKIASPTHR